MKRVLQPLFVLVSAIAFAQEKPKTDSAAVLKEIETVALDGKKKLIERKPDRTIFNVENSVAAQGGDATDALRVTPGVKISGNDIKLVGKNSVNVMINDKIVQLSGEELLDYLKSIQTSNIQKIEVITNPPAKYDAEGHSGLINIQLKEVRQNNWNATLRSNYQQGFYARFTEGAGFSYKKDKLSVLTDLSYSFGKYLYQNDIHYYYPDELWHQKMFNKNHRKSFAPLLSLSYDLSKKTTIGAQFLGSFTERTPEDFTESFSRSYADNAILKHYTTIGDVSGKPQNVSFNLNLNQKLDDAGKKFSVDADYFNSKNGENNSIISDLQDFTSQTLNLQSIINNSDQNISNYSVKTDWLLPYKWAELSFGAKFSSTKTKNLVDSKFYDRPTAALLSAQNDHFEYLENNEALYISASRSFGKKWEAKAGLRGENTQTTANSVSLDEITKRNYFKLFPTLYLSYKADDDNTITANYGRRIQRPGFSMLNPARSYDTPKSYVTGNPYLQPVFVDQLEMTYNFKSLISLNIYYYQSKGDISQVVRHNVEDETVVFRHENYANSKGSGGTLTVNYNPFKWWESSTDITAYYNETSPFVEIYTKPKYSGWGGTTSTNNTFTLNKKKTLLASLNYWYSFPSLDTGISAASSSLDIGLKYLALDKKLTVGVNFDDIFKSSSPMYTDFSQNITQTFKQYYDSRRFRISLSYKFGNNKISVNQRESGNKEERSRAN